MSEGNTERCIKCGDEIEGESVYSQSGVKTDGLERLADGESVALSDLMEMEDGPYCSLDCSLQPDSDRDGGGS